jgi:hypothetical protein
MPAPTLVAQRSLQHLWVVHLICLRRDHWMIPRFVVACTAEHAPKTFDQMYFVSIHLSRQHSSPVSLLHHALTLQHFTTTPFDDVCTEHELTPALLLLLTKLRISVTLSGVKKLQKWPAWTMLPRCHSPGGNATFCVVAAGSVG